MRKAAIKNKNVPFESISMYEFGVRIKEVREKLLEMSQTELADNIGIIQGVVSRLEAGIGGSTHAAFKIISYLNFKGFQGGLIFMEPFSVSNLIISKSDKAGIKAKSKLEKAIQDLKAEHEKAISSLTIHLSKL